jgi:hypothetical protein
MRLLLLLSASAVVIVTPLEAAAQCQSDNDCRYGRTCRQGHCAYPDSSCERDVDCADGGICEGGRCLVPTPSPSAAAAELPLLPPPRPAVMRTLKVRRTDGGSRFVDPIAWGGRGPITPRPHGTSEFEFQYGSGKIPCCPEGECGDQGKASSMQLSLGGNSIIANIVSLGFSMALFRWNEVDGCHGEDFSLGDVQMRLAVLAYRNSGPNHWFGLTPFVRVLMTSGSTLTPAGGGYYAILEPGVALGYGRGMFSASLHLSGMVGFTDTDPIGGFISHLSAAVRPVSIIGIIAGFELGYGTPADQDALPVSLTAGLRLYMGQSVALDVTSRVAVTEAARFSDANAALGLWALGVKLSIVWRGYGRP